MARKPGPRQHLPVRVVSIHLTDEEWAAIRIAAVKEDKGIGLWIADSLSNKVSPCVIENCVVTNNPV